MQKGFVGAGILEIARGLWNVPAEGSCELAQLGSGGRHNLRGTGELKTDIREGST